MRTYEIRVKGRRLADALGLGGKGVISVRAIDRDTALTAAGHRIASGAVELGGVLCDDVRIVGIAVAAGRR